MKDNIIATKSEDFAVRIINLSEYMLQNNPSKNIQSLSNQILRSGTSIAANIAESKYAQSKNDLITKLSISLKEASETSMWLRLLNRTKYISDDQYNSLHNNIDELIRMLTASIKTLKTNNSNP
ncbi:MAG: four helix bundle protein [Prevotella sp.]|jgi:four helix bundle protein|nr:four helix bundle protein [Prevotella sp.]